MLHCHGQISQLAQLKDASVAVLSVGCFTEVLETKPSSPVVKVLSSSVFKKCRTLL